MRRVRFAYVWMLAVSAAQAAEPVLPAVPPAERQQELTRLVRQDCGACHGLRLTGGLGPALTPDRLGHWSPDILALTIIEGRPGTPMPPWSPFMSEDEAIWIAHRLKQGFPP